MGLRMMDTLGSAIPPDLTTLGVMASNLLFGPLRDLPVGLLEWVHRVRSFGAPDATAIAMAIPLARFHANAGDDESAERLYRETIEMARRLDPASDALLVVKSEYARFLAERHRPEDARSLLAGVVDNLEDRISTAWLHARRSERVARWRPVYDALVRALALPAMSDRTKALADSTGSAVEPAIAAFNVHEAAKSRSFLAWLADGYVPVPPSVPGALRDEEARLLQERSALQRRGHMHGEDLHRLGEITAALRV
jgi:hypothetical protein